MYFVDDFTLYVQIRIDCFEIFDIFLVVFSIDSSTSSLRNWYFSRDFFIHHSHNVRSFDYLSTQHVLFHFVSFHLQYSLIFRINCCSTLLIKWRILISTTRWKIIKTESKRSWTRFIQIAKISLNFFSKKSSNFVINMIVVSKSSNIRFILDQNLSLNEQRWQTFSWIFQNSLKRFKFKVILIDR